MPGLTKIRPELRPFVAVAATLILTAVALYFDLWIVIVNTGYIEAGIWLATLAAVITGAWDLGRNPPIIPFKSGDTPMEIEQWLKIYYEGYNTGLSGVLFGAFLFMAGGAECILHKNHGLILPPFGLTVALLGVLVFFTNAYKSFGSLFHDPGH